MKPSKSFEAAESMPIEAQRSACRNLAMKYMMLCLEL